MSFTNFPRGITSMGVPQLGGGIPATFGKYIFVDYDNGSDGYDGLSMDKPVKTVARAYALATTNKNDVIALSAYSSHPLSEMLTVDKNRVHFIGLDCGGRYYGQRAKISMGVTTAVTDIFSVKNIGSGNTFTNIKFSNVNTLTQNTAAVGEGGEYTLYRGCEIYDSTKLTSDTHAELLLNSDSAQFVGCTFGSQADAVTGDKVRPAVITTKGGVAGALSGGVNRDVLFDACRFWKQAGGTSTAFVKVLASDEIERMMEFHNCYFFAAKLGSVPAVAISLGEALAKGQIILTGDTVAVNCTKIATGTGVISCQPARVATATIGLQAT